MKKLYKSKDDKILAGVLGGIGEYFEVDPVFIRIGYVLLAIISGHRSIMLFVFAYIIFLLIIPKHPNVPQVEVVEMPAKKEDVETKTDK